MRVAGSDTAWWQGLAGVTRGDPGAVTCHLSRISFHQNWSMEVFQWSVGLSAGILCKILNSGALRQLPSILPAPSMPPPDWHQGMSLQEGLGGWEMSLALPVCLEGLAARAV